jgi:hypothetical protein
MPPLLIYPEGCTTNNTALLQFKKGAFYSLLSVQPISLKYYSPMQNPAHDVMPMFPHFVFLCTALYTTVQIKEYPVFKPNEFFWEKHWDEKSGEQKWEAYARVVRGIFAESFNFKLSDLAQEDKAAYKSLLYGRQVKLD